MWVHQSGAKCQPWLQAQHLPWPRQGDRDTEEMHGGDSRGFALGFQKAPSALHLRTSKIQMEECSRGQTITLITDKTVGRIFLWWLKSRLTSALTYLITVSAGPQQAILRAEIPNMHSVLRIETSCQQAEDPGEEVKKFSQPGSFFQTTMKRTCSSNSSEQEGGDIYIATYIYISFTLLYSRI